MYVQDQIPCDLSLKTFISKKRFQRNKNVIAKACCRKHKLRYVGTI